MNILTCHGTEVSITPDDIVAIQQGTVRILDDAGAIVYGRCDTGEQ